ncbi:MAG: MutS-related protein [Cytophagales bacterium]
MEFVLLIATGLIAIVVILHHAHKRANQKKLAQIRSNWGKPKKQSFDFDYIERFADVTSNNSYHRLTEQTKQDIDFNSVFMFVDRTTSSVGQQILYKTLTEPSVGTSPEQEKLIELFSDNKSLRESMQLLLLRLNNVAAYSISNLLKESLLIKPKWFWLLKLNLLAIAVCSSLSLWYDVFIVALIFPLTINAFVHYWNKSNTFQFSRSFPQLNNLVEVAKLILKSDAVFFDSNVDGGIRELSPFQRKLLLIRLNAESDIQGELSQLGTYVTELFKAFLLVEVFTLHRIVKELEGKKISIRILMEFVGKIDSTLSIASLRAGSYKTCIPKFLCKARELDIKQAYHPLIENCTKNDFSIRGKSVLITGSNMSGKSTFLRTMAINSILAQTIGTCFADEFSTPKLKQFTSIRINDNLVDGKSYYLEEVNVMSVLLEQAMLEPQNLFILDEVFKGTNTMERIAAGKAILSFLNQQHHIVLVSTHDVELAEMLKDEYALFHFTEVVENNKLTFDHQLKQGPLTTRNAIKILELSGYPTKLTNEAKLIYTGLSKSVSVKAGAKAQT